MIAAQPSDFLVAQSFIKTKGTAGWVVLDEAGNQVAERRAYHVETKATTKNKLTHKTLRQYGMLKKWWWAGVQPIVLVHRLDSDDWVILLAYRLFPGHDPFEYSDEPAPRSFDFDNLVGYPSAEAALRDAFNIRTKA